MTVATARLGPVPHDRTSWMTRTQRCTAACESRATVLQQLRSAGVLADVASTKLGRTLGTNAVRGG